MKGMDAHSPNGSSRGFSSSTPLPGPDMPASAETLGQLAGQIAHDLNNLLATALIGVELAAQVDGDAPRVRKLLAGAAEAIARQRDLTTAMALAAQACAQPVLLDLHAFVEARRDELGRALGAAELELRLDAQHARIRCDARFLHAALLHLACNAGASMPHGGRLLLATHNRDARSGETAGRRFVQLTAVDSGQGMTDEVSRRAFDLFFSTRAGGCGLGLAQVRDTARRAGGSATLESAPGQGTAISLGFPLAD
jgi:signal transduction histidine kinase